MNAILKTVIIGAIFLGLTAAINLLIPANFSTEINNDFIFFLQLIRPVDFLIPVNAVFGAMQIVGNFIFGIAAFYIIFWLSHFYTQS